MNYRDHLLMRARSYWGNGDPIPADLFSEMLSAGIDIAEAEKNFHATNDR